jgi:hypothetical protein
LIPIHCFTSVDRTLIDLLVAQKYYSSALRS